MLRGLSLFSLLFGSYWNAHKCAFLAWAVEVFQNRCFGLSVTEAFEQWMRNRWLQISVDFSFILLSLAVACQRSAKFIPKIRCPVWQFVSSFVFYWFNVTQKKNVVCHTSFHRELVVFSCFHWLVIRSNNNKKTMGAKKVGETAWRTRWNNNNNKWRKKKALCVM